MYNTAFFFNSSDAEACTAMILNYVHSFQQIQLHDWIISDKAVNVLLQVKQLQHRYIDYYF